MRRYQLDQASGCRLVGGEMLNWSDLKGGRSPGAALPLLARLLPALPDRARVLLAGPRAATLAESLPEGLPVDVLVRGLPDARELSNVARVRTDVTLYCGSLDRFEPEVAYDLVISLDGPDYLMSPDAEVGISGPDLLKRLSGWLAADGVLVGSVVNELGFDRMFRLELRREHDGDTAWHRGVAGYDDRHAYRRELDGYLSGASLTPLATYAAFPAVENPALLISEELSGAAASSSTASAVACMAARIESSHFSTRPALVDAHDVALRVFEGGLALELSPLWVVIATRQPRGDAPRPTLPLMLSAGEMGRPEWRAVTKIERLDDGWSFQVQPVVGSSEMRERNVLRDYTAVREELPQGGTLEVLLRRACAVNNMREARRLVQLYAEWLRKPQPAGDATADGRFFLTPSNVVVEGSELRALDPTWYWAGDSSWEALVIRGLRDFARRLLRSGAEHPWSPDISPDALTQTLAAMVGVEWDHAMVQSVALAEAQVETVVNGGDAAYEAHAYQANLEGGQSQAASTVGPSRGYRAAVASGGRLAEALHERGGQVEWLEAALRARDIRVGELERTVGHIRGSLSFRIGRGLTWPLRSMVGGVRRLGMSLIPPGYLHRARRLAERLASR